MLWICSQSTPPTHLTACVATWWRSLFSSWSSLSLIFSFCYKTAFTLSLSSYYNHICAVSSYCHHHWIISFFHIFSSLYDHLTLRMPFLGNTLMRAFTLPSPPLAMRRTREFRLGHKCTGLQLLLGLWPLSFWIFRIWSLSRCLKLGNAGTPILPLLRGLTTSCTEHRAI